MLRTSTTFFKFLSKISQTSSLTVTNISSSLGTGHRDFMTLLAMVFSGLGNPYVARTISSMIFRISF